MSKKKKTKSKNAQKKIAFLAISLDPQLAGWVRASAKREATSISAFVRRALIAVRSKGQKK